MSRGVETQAPPAAQAELRRLVSEQAALRRVATFVAGEPAPDEVFQLVTEEVCALLQLRSALLVRYEPGELLTIVGAFGAPPDQLAIESPPGGGTLVPARLPLPATGRERPATRRRP